MIDGTRSGRFLDTPEFSAFHDIGNNGTVFDRFDFQPTSQDVVHLNLFVAEIGFKFRTTTISWLRIKGNGSLLGTLRLAISTPSILMSF